jgi:hypothetical protein
MSVASERKLIEKWLELLKKEESDTSQQVSRGFSNLAYNART